jgi:hypothetical protein
MGGAKAISDEKIYVDASRAATLNNGAAVDDCPTLKEALLAWHRLSPEPKRATIGCGRPALHSREAE